MKSWELRSLHEALGKVMGLDKVVASESLSIHKVRRLLASLVLDAEDKEAEEYRQQQEERKEEARRLEESRAGEEALVNGLPAREEVNGFIIERTDGGL